jgi:Fe-S-cluster containining protein
MTATSALPSAVDAAPACARCAVLQRTCCQRAEILLTTGDVERIARHTRRETFHERRVPRDLAYRVPDSDDPRWLGYTTAPDGTRRMLVRRADGDCSFLGRLGCELPLAVRPLVCRLYPYDYNESGLTGLDPDYCPTVHLAPQGQPMNVVLDIPATAAEGWRRQLYEELRHGTP